jgi:hypothetical protein
LKATLVAEVGFTLVAKGGVEGAVEFKFQKKAAGKTKKK